MVLVATLVRFVSLVHLALDTIVMLDLSAGSGGTSEVSTIFGAGGLCGRWSWHVNRAYGLGGQTGGVCLFSTFILGHSSTDRFHVSWRH
jgi:hypothetical protein